MRSFAVFTSFETKRFFVGFLPLDARGICIDEHNVEL